MEPISVEFPLRGEWMIVNSPGSKVPSHGTEVFGETYAYDFVGADHTKKNLKFFKKSSLDYLLGRAGLNNFYGWGKPIFAPFSATVVEASDGYPERQTFDMIHNFLVVSRNALAFNQNKIRLKDLAGNYVILKGDESYAVLVHMREDSVMVNRGDNVDIGDLLGEVGHSGNSTMPHLHFHLMDNPDAFIAKGIPCSFKKYELYKQGKWITVRNGIPKNDEIVRYNGKSR